MKTQTFALVAVSLLVGGLAAPAVSGLVAAEGVPDVLRAHRIELVDTAGQQRARLNVEDDGTVVFRLMAANGEIRVKLGADDDGSGLVLLNNATEPGAHMLADEKGVSLRLTDGTSEQLIAP